MKFSELLQQSMGGEAGMELAPEDEELLAQDDVLIENPEALEEDMRKSLTDLLYRRMQKQREAAEEMQAKALG